MLRKLLLLGALISAPCVAPPPAQGAELTLDAVKALIAMSGVNPGTSRQIGSFGIQTLTKVEVKKGENKGDFVIHLHIVDRAVKHADIP